jgi:DNA-directed RNA polymerase specialized sigma24 family protein
MSAALGNLRKRPAANAASELFCQLRYVAELEYAEIAQALDIPIGTAKRRVFDAIKVLHDRMVRP